jgi:hypothetical protein
MFRRAAGELLPDPALMDDGVSIVSELAANTLHVRQEQHYEATPELWVYLRDVGRWRELVCKVFDAYPGWLQPNPPGPDGRRVVSDAISGRGLEVVHELSSGRWGYHLTRARLGGWDVPGKAVWFAMPVSGADTTTADPGKMTASEAMTDLEAGLVARGFGGKNGKMVRADDPVADMAVLSVCGGLTVWCRAGLAWLRGPGVTDRHWRCDDLVEVAEQTVQAYETVRTEAEAAGAALPDASPEPIGEFVVGTQHHLPEARLVDISRHGTVRGIASREIGHSHS